MVTKGLYKTFGNSKAHVVQVRSRGPNMWEFRGYIEHEGVCYFHAWNIQGQSGTQNPANDLNIETWER